MYDRVLAGTERRVLGHQRARLLGRARGAVLEVGAGTGANLAHYPRTGQVTRLDVTEPDPHMRRRLVARVDAADLPFPVFVHDVGAEGPFVGAPFDTVVSTLVLCTVPDAAMAATALHAALAPGGELLYLEHVVTEGLRGRAQRRLDPLWGCVAGGCHVDRDTLATLRAVGFATAEQDWVDLPFPLGTTTIGAAVHRVRPAPAPGAGPPVG